ncbi:2-keto-4-pentenoate hydratase/2-oxohepta-3-ene-1,7-dioic acid hydratase (catechol pathway) [Tistlia consotensis]|uniref:2-keto-4-pentenoate hydratase/2-oxohepta-3-ene-1,7-dioic acid hydratase (Catechol pathway) n=1 Tax=Tistlia consotensis USBA 355 TaxID=560819 RepID=A0A1Y6B5D3_9PROT|nr:fumarylacetoacetate hydrolase family protein [Tistlia consotensis]SME90447.1 2-keto-4-pentenoate hydratase/2-oxohepta-3-ene-1,7-dioic acid hydratase (catechol pathway) [Tistlia consotensis USBA 355]SNR26749.1 2-keto-4-pentenoate hydratase/2-oxohepta-3-ene-1,7-dioic acid hydratase (catechol pathway) [Tistlia consotensis]
MKLLRFGEPGAEKPGLLDKGGKIRDLSSVVPDIAGPALSPAGLDKLRKVDPASLPEVPASTRLGPCVGQVGNFIAIGLNYVDHAEETGLAIPTEPVVFSKATSCLSGPNDAIVLPEGSVKTDWEVEIAFVMGQAAYRVEEKDALGYVAGFCLCHDVSERAFQIERGGQWIKGKSAPTFGPLGPWLVTPDEVADVQNLRLWCDVNGKRMQDGTTAKMIFSIAYLVSYLSRFMRLLPGDVVTTGTPAGVGLGMKPNVFLKAGDVVELGIEQLGEQRQEVKAFG